MRKIVELLKRTPGREFTLVEMEQQKLIPWARNLRTIRKIIAADKKGQNLLKAKVTGTASMRRYIVSSDALLAYLQSHGPILMATVRKQPKQKYGTEKRKGGGRSRT